MTSGKPNKTTNPPQSPFTKGGFRGILVLLFLIFLSKEAMADAPHPPPLPQGERWRVEEVFSEEKQYDFAMSLFNEGEYYRAITEWKRFIYYFPKSNLIDDATLFIGKSYFMGEKYDDAINKFMDFREAFPDSNLIPECLYLRGITHFKKEEYHLARGLFELVRTKYPDSIWADKSVIMNSWSYAKEGDFHEANAKIKQEKIMDEKLRLMVKEFSSEIEKGEMIPKKSPRTAGLLAAILPGSGHFYLGRYKDGTVAFLLNASFIWGAVASFQQGNYAVGGILTFFEVGWYTGNIYSAVGAAHKYNKLEEDRFRDDIEKKFKPHLSQDFTAPLVSVTLRF